MKKQKTQSLSTKKKRVNEKCIKCSFTVCMCRCFMRFQSASNAISLQPLGFWRALRIRKITSSHSAQCGASKRASASSTSANSTSLHLLLCLAATSNLSIAQSAIPALSQQEAAQQIDFIAPWNENTDIEWCFLMSLQKPRSGLENKWCD